MAPGALSAALPPFTVGSVVIAWRADSLLTVFLVVAGGLCLYGGRRLRARGDHWPVARTLFFLAPGLGSIALATMSGLGTYDDTLLSAHMIQHMVLSMVAPIFLALGAPVTLALRTLPVRGRRALVRLLPRRVGRPLGFPLVADGVFVAHSFGRYSTQ